MVDPAQHRHGLGADPAGRGADLRHPVCPAADGVLNGGGDPDPALRTARLVLRRARPGDLDGLHAVLSDPRAMRYWSTPPHRELEQTRSFLAQMIAASPDEADEFVVERAGRVIGKAGLWRLPEIGFILHPSAWGQGLATEALAAIIPCAFARFPIPAITADVDPRNKACLRLLRRLGFAETGRAARTWQVGEEWCDSVYLALPRRGSVMRVGGGQGGDRVGGDAGERPVDRA